GDGGEPDAVDTEAGDMIKPVDNARQITDAITVAILKRAGIDLINYSAAPPFSHRYAPNPDSRPRLAASVSAVNLAQRRAGFPPPVSKHGAAIRCRDKGDLS